MRSPDTRNYPDCQTLFVRRASIRAVCALRTRYPYSNRIRPRTLAKGLPRRGFLRRTDTFALTRNRSNGPRLTSVGFFLSCDNGCDMGCHMGMGKGWEWEWPTGFPHNF